MGKKIGRFPDFIIIGAQKSGTSALWYNLNKHSDIGLVRQANDSPTYNGMEMNFWGSRNESKGLDWYKSHFILPKRILSSIFLLSLEL